MCRNYALFLLIYSVNSVYQGKASGRSFKRNKSYTNITYLESVCDKLSEIIIIIIMFSDSIFHQCISFSQKLILQTAN